jgi:hypothetical protein
LYKTLDFIGSQAFYGDSPLPLEAILDHIEAFQGLNLLSGFPYFPRYLGPTTLLSAKSAPEMPQDELFKHIG